MTPSVYADAAAAASTQAACASSSAAPGTLRSLNRILDADSVLGLGLTFEPDKDYNRVTSDELVEVKSAMDEVFRKTVVLPGQPGYVYNLQKEFEPEASQQNDWDDEDGADACSEASCSDIPWADILTTVSTKSALS